MSLPVRKDFKKTLARVAELRAEAEQLERATIRAALALVKGLPSYAADLLGMSRSVLTGWLRRQYADIGAEALSMREQAGYTGGNPTLVGMGEGEIR